MSSRVPPVSYWQVRVSSVQGGAGPAVFQVFIPLYRNHSAGLNTAHGINLFQDNCNNISVKNGENTTNPIMRTSMKNTSDSGVVFGMGTILLEKVSVLVLLLLLYSKLLSQAYLRLRKPPLVEASGLTLKMTLQTKIHWILKILKTSYRKTLHSLRRVNL